LKPNEVDQLSYKRPELSQRIGERINLNNGFRLHPALTHLKTFYDAGDVTFIHACSTSYRQRSQENLLDRLTELYAGDPQFSTSLKTARQNKISGLPINRRMNKRFTFESTIALKALGERMTMDGGPGVGMVALDGWDTHANQANLLNRKFKNLNEGLHALKQELSDHWKNTCIVIASEFGRTAAMNGTRGTDHGTGGLLILLGGAVKGGNIKGDWPGIRPKDLYKGRDLAPANDVTAVLKGVLRDHMGIDRTTLNNSIFPNSNRPFDGLIES